MLRCVEVNLKCFVSVQLYLVHYALSTVQLYLLRYVLSTVQLYFVSYVHSTVQLVVLGASCT